MVNGVLNIYVIHRKTTGRTINRGSGKDAIFSEAEYWVCYFSAAFKALLTQLQRTPYQSIGTRSGIIPLAYSTLCRSYNRERNESVHSGRRSASDQLAYTFPACFADSTHSHEWKISKSIRVCGSKPIHLWDFEEPRPTRINPGWWQKDFWRFTVVVWLYPW